MYLQGLLELFLHGVGSLGLLETKCKLLLLELQSLFLSLQCLHSLKELSCLYELLWSLLGWRGRRGRSLTQCHQTRFLKPQMISLRQTKVSSFWGKNFTNARRGETQMPCPHSYRVCFNKKRTWLTHFLILLSCLSPRLGIAFP